MLAVFSSGRHPTEPLRSSHHTMSPWAVYDEMSWLLTPSSRPKNRRRPRPPPRNSAIGPGNDDELAWSEPPLSSSNARRRGSDTTRNDGGSYSYRRQSSSGADSTTFGGHAGSSRSAPGGASGMGMGIGSGGSRGGGRRGTGTGLLRGDNPPTLTVILMRLHACLPAYCEALAGAPSVDSAARAAKVLDESLYEKPPNSKPEVPPPRSADATPKARPSRPAASSIAPQPPPQPQPPQSSSPLSNISLWARKTALSLSSGNLSPRSALSSPLYPSSSRDDNNGNSNDNNSNDIAADSSSRSRFHRTRSSGGIGKRGFGRAYGGGYGSSDGGGYAYGYSYGMGPLGMGLVGGGGTPSRGGGSRGGGFYHPYGDPLLAEWDRIVSPLTLLAGAEGLYRSLEHVTDVAGGGFALASSAGDGAAAAAAAAAAVSPNHSSSSPSSSPIRKRSRIKSGRMSWTSKGKSTSPTASSQWEMEKVDEKEKEGTDEEHRQHLNLPPSTERIRSMFGKVMKDLVIVREILCDPILGLEENDDDDTSTADWTGGSSDDSPAVLIPPTAAALAETDSSSATATTAAKATDPLSAAKSLARSISVLIQFCETRQNLIAVHADLVLLGEKESGGGGGAAAAAAARDDDGEANGRNNIFDLADRIDTAFISIPGSNSEDGDDGDGTDSATRPILEAVRHEIKGTAAALRMMGQIENCCFFETIINCKRVKVHLGPSSPFHSESQASSLEIWLRNMMAGVLSLQKIYFDRIDAYHTSVFGFQNHIMVEDNSQVAVGVSSTPRGSPTASLTSRSKADWFGVLSDLDTEVIELLHIHEERSGAPLAVAVIFDPKNCSDQSFEQGYVAPSGGKVSDEAISVGVKGIENAWPVIYLRTSEKSGDPNYEQCLTGNINAGMSRKTTRRASKGMSMSGLSSLLTPEIGSSISMSIKRPSYGGNTSRASLISLASESSQGVDGIEQPSLAPSSVVKAAEYGFDSDTGADATATAQDKKMAWPLSEIPTVVSIVRKDDNPGEESSLQHDPIAHDAKPLSSFDSPKRAGLIRNPFSPLIEQVLEEEASTVEAASPVRSITSSPSPTRTRTHLSSPTTQQQQHPASYHFVQVNENMRLSIIIKGEEDEWRLRRKVRGLTDDEIRLWLSQFAARLRVSRLCSAKSVIEARKSSKGLQLPRPPAANPKQIRWKDSETNEYLLNLKHSFGLKPSSPLAAPLKSPYIRRDSLFGSTRRGQPEHPKDDASAAAFFLGPALGHMLSS